jgi:hypothetical protein
VFGVTDGGDADFAAMVQFGDSTIRLAEIARQAGRAVDVNQQVPWGSDVQKFVFDAPRKAKREGWNGRHTTDA